ncbi:hypothetical protein CANINC_003418 [Pichia inconspicua]|uniref:Uncharacterized protein n=1 Tax=Pichia inconspicua TaxID=52247 RepID=A0A4T0WYW1_9ASCO|nr:hypothetical protein CANINC_003418 [[Candida] inconspicua]
MLGKKHFDTNINEDTVIELLQSITKPPVPISKYQYHNLRNLSTSNVLPPSSEFKNNFSEYIRAITLKAYTSIMKDKIDNIVTDILKTIPEKLSEEDYLNILFYFHKTSNFNMQFEMLKIMKASSDLNQTIDFDNILLSRNFRPTIYKYLIQRLETLQEKGVLANNNTWYYLFDVFENPEPKIQMLKLMKEYEIDMKPILPFLSSLLPYYSSDQLLDLYKSSGYDGGIDQLPMSLFNQHAQILLNHGKLKDLWTLLVSEPKFRRFLNPSLFVHILSHLLENNQVGYAFALTNLVLHKYNFPKKLSQNVLESKLLNSYLPNAEYFDNWLSLTRIVYPMFNKREAVHLNARTVSRLNDYCKIHNIEPNFKTKVPKDIRLMKQINNDLVWKDGEPEWNLSENTPNFIRAANAVNQFK